MSKINFDTNQSLEQLEEDYWGEPPVAQRASNLVRRVYRLRRVPLQDFDAEDIRTFVGQKLSQEYIIPLAIEWLETHLWPNRTLGWQSERHTIYGMWALLQWILEVPKPDFWAGNPDLWKALKPILDEAIASFPKVSPYGYSIITYKTQFRESSMMESVLNARKSFTDQEEAGLAK